VDRSGRDLNASTPWACGTRYPAKNIRINNITCDGSHGLTIGSEMSGGVENVSFTNINIRNSGPSVRIKSQCGRRAYIRNVLYENITADEVSNAVWIDMMYFSKVSTCTPSEVSTFENITVRNLFVDHITGNGAAFEIVGESHALTDKSTVLIDCLLCAALLFEDVSLSLYSDRAALLGLELIGEPGVVPIRGITLENISVQHYGRPGTCTNANVTAVNVQPPLPRGVGCSGAPPPPAAHCIATTSGRGCYNDSRSEGLGMSFQDAVHDHTTLEACAAACFGRHEPVAAIDGGNHCFCGRAGALANFSQLSRPMSECEKTECYANKAEKCGGPGRLLTYSYTCH
jgi:hypothetical protein